MKSVWNLEALDEGEWISARILLCLVMGSRDELGFERVPEALYRGVF